MTPRTFPTTTPIADQSGLLQSPKRSRLAPVGSLLGVAGAIGCGISLVAAIGLGLFSPQALDALLFVAIGLLGALVVSREPANSIGWLMCLASVVAMLLLLPADYGYMALVVEHGAWPLGVFAVWLAAWGWVAIIGLFPALITARFPDGRTRPVWRVAEWLALGGTLALSLGIALASADVQQGFIPLRQSDATLLRVAAGDGPLGWSLPDPIAGPVRVIGLLTIVAGYVGAVASFVGRFRAARGEERLQFAWFAYAGLLIGAAAIWAVVAYTIFDAAFGDALLPFALAAFAFPSAIAIAILRYHLYDIELIVRRTAVYVPLTGLLAGLYSATLATLQRIFQGVLGNPSEGAIILSTLVLAAAFTPLRNALQDAVNRRFRDSMDTERRLKDFLERVNSSLSPLDSTRVLRAYLGVVVAAVGALGGAVYLQTASDERLLADTPRRAPNPVFTTAIATGTEVAWILVIDAGRHGRTLSHREQALVQASALRLGELLAE
jgi:hypothetical protein